MRYRKRFIKRQASDMNAGRGISAHWSRAQKSRSHRGTSVMSISQITPTLFLSGADASMNQALMTRKGITLIVNVTLSHTCPVYPGVECIRVAVSDLPNARLGDHFDHVSARIHNNRPGGTLVHCAAGMSRSPAVIMAYLMKYKGVTLRQAHKWVKDSRPYIRLNVGFWTQLLDYERKLYGRNTVRVAEPVDAQPTPQTPKLPSRYKMRQCPPSPRASQLRRFTSFSS
ncbi:dual specificity protein phosphatase 18 isoform X3 [Danio rerio]|uniref:Dual specificity protein phosphatase 18 isoform X3 n=1 Tax=Danio rerio TaxID=7955 RepID=A0AC58HA66_DANRE